MMKADQHALIMRNPLVLMEQKHHPVRMEKSQLALTELSLHVLMGPHREDLAVLMDPLLPLALMATLQLALMELRSPLVLMARKQDVPRGPHLSVKMEQLQDSQDILMENLFQIRFQNCQNLQLILIKSEIDHCKSHVWEEG